ncbi:MAG: hypothetical protein MJ252_00160, partial [archaeon]|nr:hypothetical protein [archaeon]
EKSDFEISDFKDLNSANDLDELREKYKKNNDTILEYENHLRLLLSILSETQMDYASQIQKGLEKVKFLSEENIMEKRNLFLQIMKNEEIKNKINTEKAEIEKKKEEISNTPEGKLLIEKMQVLNDINTLSNEIDNYTTKNNNYVNIIKIKNDPNANQRVLEEIEALKKENEQPYSLDLGHK